VSEIDFEEKEEERNESFQWEVWTVMSDKEKIF
jgi:hypothetical protein